MTTWIDGIRLLVLRLLGNPHPGLQMTLVMVIAAAVLWAAFRFSCKAFRIPARPAAMALAALAIGVVILLGTVSALSLYVLPHVKDQSVARWATYGAPVVLWLIVGVPLQAWLLKGTYVQALCSFAIACLLSIGLANVAMIVSESVTTKGKQSQTIRERSRNFESLLEEGKKK